MIEGHGDDFYNYGREIVSNFSSNVYGRVDHTGLYARLAECLPGVGSYPEPAPHALERLLARKHGIAPAEVCVTAGATEAIYLIAQTFAGRTSAVLMPTFSEYADACRMHRHTVKPFYTLEALPEQADVVWICNPNNPTGEVRDRARLEELLRRHPDKLFVFDHAYEHFTLERLLSAREAMALPNVILIHSLTKRYSIPGLRIGYFTAGEALTAEIRRRKMPWSVNALAIEAAAYCIAEGVGGGIDISALLAERERLAQALAATGLVELWPTDTHYMLLRLRMGRASALKEYLAVQHGMLIRDASNFEGLDPAFFRIAVQTPQENDRLVAAIVQWAAAETNR